MLIRHIRCAVAFTVTLLSFCQPGAARPVGQAVSRPAGVVLVAATVEGQPATLLLDTGAERSCLDSYFAAMTRLRTVGQESIRQPYATGVADTVHVADLEIQSFHIEGVDMLSSDLSAMALAAGVPVDGILGADLLRRFTVRIDFYSGSAQFATTANPPARASLVKLQPDHNLYFVPLSVQGTPVRLLLDSGANSSSISSQAWSNVTRYWQPEFTVDGIRSTGGTGSTKFVLIPSIGLGSASADNIPLRIQPETMDGLFADASFDGLLGTDVLRQFIVTLDLAHERMYLASNPHSDADGDRFSTIGIQFARNPEGTLTIMAVWNPSPAAKAGLKIGDKILAVNQLDTRPMNLDDFSGEIHGRPGKKVFLVIDSEGHKYSVPMETSCLLCSQGVEPKKPK